MAVRFEMRSRTLFSASKMSMVSLRDFNSRACISAAFLLKAVLPDGSQMSCALDSCMRINSDVPRLALLHQQEVHASHKISKLREV